ncbi:hypothetical protein ScPMuIL_000704 [Solemya velum]
MKPTFTHFILVVFLAYIAHSMWTLYGLFFPKLCQPGNRCIKPYLAKNSELEMHIFTSLKKKQVGESDLDPIWRNNNFSFKDTIEKEFNVSIPVKTRKNGTCMSIAFVFPKGHDPLISQYTSHSEAILPPDRPVTHWRKKLTVTVMQDVVAFDVNSLPIEIYRIMRY